VVELGAEESIGQRFGVFDGLIERDGLASPTEMLVYARPEEGSKATARTFYVSGFGIENPSLGVGLIGEALWAQPLSKFLILMSFFLVAPCLVLLVASSRLRLPERQRRSSTLAVLGASFRIRARLDMATMTRPIAWGTCAAATVIGVITVRDTPLPGTGYILQAEDLRRHWGMIVGAAAICLILFLLMLVYSGRPRFGATDTKPSAHTREPRAGLAALALLAAPVTTGILLLVREVDGAYWAIDLYLVALVITILTLSQLVGWVTFQVARSLRQSGQRGNSPGEMVAGATLMRDHKAVVRFGSAIAAIMIIAAQAQSMNAVAGQDALNEIAIRQELNGEYAEVVIDSNDLPSLPALIAKIDAVPNTAVIVVESWMSTRPGIAMDHIVWGEPSALEAWSLPPEGQLESILPLPRKDFTALGRYIGINETAEIEPTSFDPGRSSDHAWVSRVVYVKSEDGSPLVLNDLKVAVRSITYPGEIGYPGDSSYLGAWMGRHQGRWLGWFATIGTLILAVALLAVGSDDVVRSARKLAPTAALFGARRATSEFAALRIGIPTAVGVILGGVIALMLTSPLSLIADVPMPIGAVVSTSAAAVLVSVFLWRLVAREVNRLSRQWDGRTMRSR
jgi:hypothetical protein